MRSYNYRPLRPVKLQRERQSVSSLDLGFISPISESSSSKLKTNKKAPCYPHSVYSTQKSLRLKRCPKPAKIDNNDAIYNGNDYGKLLTHYHHKVNPVMTNDEIQCIYDIIDDDIELESNEPSSTTPTSSTFKGIPSYFQHFNDEEPRHRLKRLSESHSVVNALEFIKNKTISTTCSASDGSSASHTASNWTLLQSHTQNMVEYDSFAQDEI